jgi:hypothetical protein
MRKVQSRPMEAPRDSEGTAGHRASPFSMENGTAFHPQPHGYRHGLLFRQRMPNPVNRRCVLNLMEAPRDSEGTAGHWARPFPMANGTAFHPQSHGYRHGLLFRQRMPNLKVDATTAIATNRHGLQFRQRMPNPVDRRCVLNLMEAPRDSEGTAEHWARPFPMANGTAFHPQSHGYRHGLLCGKFNHAPWKPLAIARGRRVVGRPRSQWKTGRPSTRSPTAIAMGFYAESSTTPHGSPSR